MLGLEFILNGAMTCEMNYRILKYHQMSGSAGEVLEGDLDVTLTNLEPEDEEGEPRKLKT